MLDSFEHIHWQTKNTFIAHFDILGFKQMISHVDNSFAMSLLKETLDEAISKTRQDISVFADGISLTIYADTIILHSRSEKDSDYPNLIRTAKKFIQHCLTLRLPIRGAVAYGEISIGHDDRILLGKAALESYIYCESQNWIGLILTPTCTDRLIHLGVFPVRHGFHDTAIPVKGLRATPYNAMAYGFENSKGWLIPILKELRRNAPKRAKSKYTNTINFLKQLSHH